MLGSTGTRAQARKHAGHPGSQCIGTGELSPSVFPLHSQVAQSGRCKDYVREPRRCGLPGNGHQMISEKNSAEIAKYFMGWLEKNVR